MFYRLKLFECFIELIISFCNLYPLPQAFPLRMTSGSPFKVVLKQTNKELIFCIHIFPKYIFTSYNNYQNVCVDALLKQLTACHESSCVQIVAFSWPVQRCRVTWVFYPCGSHNESNISTPGPSSLLTIQLLLVVVVLVSYYSSVSRVACRVAFVRRLSLSLCLPVCMSMSVRRRAFAAFVVRGGGGFEVE